MGSYSQKLPLILKYVVWALVEGGALVIVCSDWIGGVGGLSGSVIGDDI